MASREWDFWKVHKQSKISSSVFACLLNNVIQCSWLQLSHYLSSRPAYSNLQAIQFSTGLYPEISNLFHKALNLKTDVLNKWLAPYTQHKVDARLVVILLNRPKSTGELTLSSTDPFENPTINPRYLSEQDDVEALLFGVKKIVDLYENTTALNTPLFHKPVPGCEHTEFKSDDYYRCLIRHISGSFYHPVGTCALGKVVDSKLR